MSESKFENYYGYVNEEANNFVSEYKEDLLAEIKDGNTDVHTYVNDSRLHEWVDNDFIYVDLIDSAYILNQSDNVETDWGLWDGQEPQKAVETQAFFTYRGDLGYAVMDKLETILNDEVDELKTQLENLKEELENEDDDEAIDNIQEAIDEAEQHISYFEDAINEM